MEHGDRIRPLHAYYCKKTSLEIPCAHPIDYLWRRLIKQGWTDRDFQILIRWVLKRRYDKKVTDAALRLSNLLDPIKAAENLAAANKYIATVERSKRRATARLAAQPTPEDETSALPDPEILDSLEALKTRLKSGRDST